METKKIVTKDRYHTGSMKQCYVTLAPKGLMTLPSAQHPASGLEESMAVEK